MIDFQNKLEKAHSSEIFYFNKAIVRLQTTMIVPAKPNEKGTMFVWPGLQSVPLAENWEPIVNGVLQPVLTWGPTCAPAPNKPENYLTWWISGQYVNTDSATLPEYAGCYSGELITAEPGDYLFIDMSLDENTNIWTQMIINQRTGEKTDFSFNLRGQAQMNAEFIIEPFSSIMTSPVVFIHTKITCDKSFNSNEVIIVNGGIVSPLVIEDDGLSCFIDCIVIKQNLGCESPWGVCKEFW